MIKHHASWLLAALFLAGIAATPVRADLQGEMNQFFDSLANTTDPTVTSTARRGVIAGGGAQFRNRIVDTNLVTFTPPSFQGGCGGVDLFGGSFSYVSGDQIVPLLKAIASNAVGYAFQICKKRSEIGPRKRLDRLTVAE
jgi:conjugative transfer pilus assembly protein TraH